jgi:allantoate deiminase
MTDRDGVALGAALRDFGGDPDGLAALARDPSSVLGFVETHIEQGPVLEAEGLAVGVVTAIAGIERHAVEIAGLAGHAGTTPMALRHDALCAAAEIVSAVERLCGDSEAVVGTVGALDVSPNVVNAIPGEVGMTIELRSADDAARAAMRARVGEAARDAAAARGCTLSMRLTYEQRAKACDPALMDALSAALAATGQPERRLMSGATHDASAMADLGPMAMLFLRCRGGVSHHPDEFATPEDMGVAVEVLRRFMLGVRRS